MTGWDEDVRPLGDASVVRAAQRRAAWALLLGLLAMGLTLLCATVASAQSYTLQGSELVVTALPSRAGETDCLWVDAGGRAKRGACPTGTVTSVGLTMPSIFSVSGSPITTSGTLAVSLATQAANLVFAGPTSGGAAAPTFRSVVRADIPSALAYEDEANAFTANQTIGDSSYLSRATYASQTTGWRIGADGSADFRYLFVDELHAKSFIADLEQALAGGQVIAKSVAMVSQTFSCPAVTNTSTLWVRDLPSMANTAAFESGDWVIARHFYRSAGSLLVAECVGTVASYADGTGANDGQQSWTFTRATGGCQGLVGDSGTNATDIAVDTLVLDYGASGAGYAEVTAADGAYGANSPYYQVVTWTTCPVAGNRSVRARWGNLSGISDYTATSCGGGPCWGQVAGDLTAAHYTIDPTNGFRWRHGTTTYGQWTGTTLTLGSTSTEHLAISTTAIEMKDGATVLGSLSGAAWVLGSTSTEHLSITSTAIEMKDGSTVLGAWSGGTLTLGQPLTANNTGQIVIDSDSIDMNWRNNSGSTETPFSVLTSGSNTAVYFGPWTAFGSSLIGRADGDRTIACSGTSCNFTVGSAGMGTLTLRGAYVVPYTADAVGLGTASAKWGSLYVTEDGTGDSLYPAVWASGKLKAKTDGYSGACAGTVTVENGIVTGCS